ncbi:MAG: hypothetical protein O7B26_13940, partial [Planctomycetota bacterium]|nr:hypothetical protein [Planctomycetota bacterium]
GEETRRWHPCCAIYRSAIFGALQAAIDAGQYGMTRLLSGLKVGAVHLRDREERWVENWNAPTDVSYGDTT